MRVKITAVPKQGSIYQGAYQQYQTGGNVKKVRITETPQMQTGGYPELRTRWNSNQRGNVPTEQWNHNPNIGQNAMPGIQPWEVAPVQNELAQWSSGAQGKLKQMGAKTPNGISAIDGYIGSKTGAYQYRPLQVEHHHAGGRPPTITNYGTDYDAGIADINQYQYNQMNPAPQVDIPLNTQPVYNYQQNTPPTVYAPQKQQDIWHTSESTEGDYSIDAVRGMKYGGRKEGNTVASFDAHSWNNTVPQGQYGVYPKPNPYQTKRVLPEAEDGQGDINAEKNEMILGDFNGDGTQALMDVSGKPHTEGGKDVNVPDGSFVYSDTKDLKIKDKGILKEFGINHKDSRKGYTPAQIAKKYDLQKFTAKIADPKSDNITRKTAELMVENMQNKLGKLQAVQEDMKASKGIPPNPGQPMMQYGGRDPLTPDDPTLWGNMMNNTGLPETAIVAKGYKKGEGRFRFDQQNPDEQQPREWGWDTRSIPIPSPYDREEVNPIEPIGPVPMANNLQANKMEPIQGIGGIGDTNITGGNKQTRSYSGYSTPDKLNMLNSALNMANIHKYGPWEPPVTAVIPQTVYMDDQRARAAIAEQANSAYNSARGQGNNSLASYLAIQGQAGTQAANVVGQVGNQNTQIANQANQQAAQITNNLLDLQRQRAIRLHQGNTVAAQQYDNAIREAKNDLVNQYNTAWKNRAGYQNVNALQEHYKVDPRTGYVEFVSPAAEAEFHKLTSGQATGRYKSIDDVNRYLNTTGLDEDEKNNIRSKWIMENELNLKDRTTTTRDSKGRTSTKNVSYGQKYGGALSKFMRE